MPYAATDPKLPTLRDPDAAAIAALAAERPVGAMILGWPHGSFEPLAPLAGLEVLKVQGAWPLARLDGIERLTRLLEFVLSTPPGSDGSGRCIEVASFAPLAKLPALARVVLSAVRPADLDLTPLTRLPALRELDVGGVPEFQLAQYAWLAVQLPGVEGRCLQPHIAIPGVGRCRKCGATERLLIGVAPRARRWACPTCHAKRLAAHEAAWAAAVEAARPRA